MNRRPYLSLFLMLLAAFFLTYNQALSQYILFEENFNNVVTGGLPNSVITNTDQIFVSGDAQSGATCSASKNLYFRNCKPSGEERFAMIYGISTVGYSDLKLFFCHRKTLCFETTVDIEWSVDNGASWNIISGYEMPATNSSWSAVSLNLPVTVENQSNVSIRWIYQTAKVNCSQFNTCDDFAGNYRIDGISLYSSTLPIELINFTCKEMNKSIELTWQTASENNSYLFEIETAVDGYNFHKIGEVAAAGFSSESVNYSFIHASPAEGLQYYRLRQVDADDRFTFSPVVSLTLEDAAEFRFYPNPVKDVLHLRFTEVSAAGAAVQLFDAWNRPILFLAIGPAASELDWDLRALPPGCYLVRLQDGHSIRSARLVKV